MRIKPKILVSNPRPIVMPATGLYQREKRKIDFDNKPKTCISLPIKRLCLLSLASLFIPLARNMLAGLNSGPFGRKLNISICKNVYIMAIFG
jgi:hypothetical protein